VSINENVSYRASGSESIHQKPEILNPIPIVVEIDRPIPNPVLTYPLEPSLIVSEEIVMTCKQTENVTTEQLYLE